MSTKVVREALRSIYARGTADEVQRAQRAMAEVEAIRKAARTIAQDMDGVEWASAEDRMAAENLMRAIAKESAQ
jgi:hypothetical protein